MAGSGRRFALEALLLVALAVAAGLAGLSAAEIIGVMALGWLLTALVELLSWHLAVRRPAPLVVAPAAPAAPAEGAVADSKPVAAEPAAALDADEIGEPIADEVVEPPDAPPPLEPGVADAADYAGGPDGESPRVAETALDEQVEAYEAADAEAPAAADEAPDSHVDSDDGADQPPEPRPRRQPFWRRRRAESDYAEGATPLERPSRRHVRLISRAADEAEDEDTAERRVEER